MGAMSSEITSLTIVYSTVYSGTDQRKHQSSASLAFVRGIHRSPVNSPHKWPVTRKMFPFDDVICTLKQPSQAGDDHIARYRRLTSPVDTVILMYHNGRMIICILNLYLVSITCWYTVTWRRGHSCFHGNRTRAQELQRTLGYEDDDLAWHRVLSWANNAGVLSLASWNVDEKAKDIRALPYADILLLAFQIYRNHISNTQRITERVRHTIIPLPESQWNNPDRCRQIYDINPQEMVI